MPTLYVREQGARLGKLEERLIVTRGSDKLLDLPAIKVDRVVVMGKGVQVSTAVLHFLAEKGVPIIFTNRSGTNFKAVVNRGPSGNGALRLAQARLMDNPGRAIEIVRAVVFGKLANQSALLRETMQARGAQAQISQVAQAAQTIDRMRAEAAKTSKIEQLRGYEGAGAAAYWRAWNSLFGHTWGFGGRAYNPPPDPINALLSFGYTLLLNETLAAVQQVGLDPYLGFFHTLEPGRPSMALDILEEFRPLLIDSLVLHLMETRSITKEQFIRPSTRPGAVYLNDEGRAVFLRTYENKLHQRILYPFTSTMATMKSAQTWRRAIFLQVQQFARAVMEEKQPYQPLIWPRLAE